MTCKDVKENKLVLAESRFYETIQMLLKPVVHKKDTFGGLSQNLQRKKS